MKPTNAIFMLLIWLAGARTAQAAEVRSADSSKGPVYEGGSLRDPFVPVNSVEPNKKKKVESIAYALEGLVWESRKPQAIVNGQIVQKGSLVGQAEVMDIDEKGVKMKLNGKQFWLKPREND